MRQINQNYETSDYLSGFYISKAFGYLLTTFSWHICKDNSMTCPKEEGIQIMRWHFLKGAKYT